MSVSLEFLANYLDLDVFQECTPAVGEMGSKIRSRIQSHARHKVLDRAVKWRGREGALGSTEWYIFRQTGYVHRSDSLQWWLEIVDDGKIVDAITI